MRTVKQMRRRIRECAETCKQAYREAVRRDDAETGHVVYLQKLTGLTVPPGADKRN